MSMTSERWLILALTIALLLLVVGQGWSHINRSGKASGVRNENDNVNENVNNATG